MANYNTEKVCCLPFPFNILGIVPIYLLIPFIFAVSDRNITCKFSDS